MSDLERLIQAMTARANLAQRAAQAAIDALARAAFEKVWAYLVDHPEADARDVILAAQVEFGGGFAQELGKAFSEVLRQSIGVQEVRALPVGDVSLSRRLYLHNVTTAAEVQALVQQHARGVLEARKLALQLYDGYNPEDGVRRPLEGSVRGLLPQALRALTEDAEARKELTALMVRGQEQAARLKSETLKAAYLDAIKAWENGASMDALKRKLEIAQREKNRFFAERISQTELHRAHMSQVSRELMADEQLTAVKIEINPAHPRTDICDLHARADLFGLGAGVYPKEDAPVPPYHPFCRCRMVPRFSIDGTAGLLNPTAASAYLRALGPEKAAQVMGSAQRAEAVMQGQGVRAVVNDGVPEAYKTRSLGVVAAAGYPLEKEPA